jgi:glycosyltransferase involved in cell wall biosynthesis
MSADLHALELLCLAPDTVVPPTNGSAARTAGLARALVPHFRRVAVHAFSMLPAPTAAGGLTVHHIPRPAFGLARMRNLAQMLLAPTLGFRFPQLLSTQNALVQLESPLLFEAARRAGLGRFILNAHNVYQDLARFPQAARRDRIFYRLTRRRQARMETWCWEAADHVIFCSTVDRDRAQALRPGVAAKSTVIPNCVDTSRFTPKPALAFAQQGTVLFMGTIRYPPNFFAVQEMCAHIAPALPHLPFVIVGNAAGAPAASPPNVRFLGTVPSTAEPLAAAQLAVAPLRHGSGTRLKILEYFAAGLPVVCTAKAAEGLDVRDGREVVLAESSADFVAAIRALHGDPARCAQLGAAARALVERRYDWSAHVPTLLALYRDEAEITVRCGDG